MYKRQTLRNVSFRIAREEQLCVENAVQTGHLDIYHLLYIKDRTGDYMLKIPEYAMSNGQLTMISRLQTDSQSLTGYDALEPFIAGESISFVQTIELQLLKFGFSSREAVLINTICYFSMYLIRPDKQYHASYDSVVGIFVGVVMLLKIEFSRTTE